MQKLHAKTMVTCRTKLQKGLQRTYQQGALDVLLAIRTFLNREENPVSYALLLDFRASLCQAIAATKNEIKALESELKKHEPDTRHEQRRQENHNQKV